MRIQFKVLVGIVLSTAFPAHSKPTNVISNCGARLLYEQKYPRKADRLVVVGMGGITPVGNTREATWEAVVAGQSGIRTVAPEESGLPVRIAGVVPDFEFSKLDGPRLKNPESLSRTHQLAYGASVEAMKHAGLLARTGKNKWELHTAASEGGIYIGSTQGETEQLEKTALDRERARQENIPFRMDSMEPLLGFSSLPGMGPAHVARGLGMHGPLLCPSSVCTSGHQAIGLAGAMIRAEQAPLMIAGGADAVISETGLLTRHKLRALSMRNEDPRAASRAFDVDRDGFVLSEGGASLVLTTELYAEEHGLKVLAYVAGFASNNDAGSLTRPDPDRQAQAHATAIARAGLTPDHVGAIVAHGTSTDIGDASELASILRAYGSHTPRLPIYSSKGNVGHTLGASGPIGAMIAIEAMNRGWMPHNLNLKQPALKVGSMFGMDESDIERFDFVVDDGRQVDIDAIAVHAFGLGGHNAVLIFIRPEPK